MQKMITLFPFWKNLLGQVENFLHFKPSVWKRLCSCARMDFGTIVLHVLLKTKKQRQVRKKKKHEWFCKKRFFSSCWGFVFHYGVFFSKNSSDVFSKKTFFLFSFACLQNCVSNVFLKWEKLKNSLFFFVLKNNSNPPFEKQKKS